MNHKTPFEALYSKKPSYSQIKIFGCECYPFLRPYNKHKLDFHTSKCVNLGVSKLHKGYLCLNPNGRIYIAAHVNFNEDSFPLKNDSNFMTPESTHTPELINTFSKFLSISFPAATQNHEATAASTSSLDDTTSSDNLPNEHNPDNNIDQINSIYESENNTHEYTQTSFLSEPNNQIPESSQPTHQPRPSHPMTTRAKNGIFKPKVYNTEKSLSLDTPSSVADALNNHKWKQAMQEEFNALMRNQTWYLVPPEQNIKLVGNKWIYRVKQNSDGSINKYKARLVAKGFLQTEGVDYQETFSPVVKAVTIRIVLSLAVINNWKLRQVDINNAFLNGELSETVYMPQPEGFENSEHPNYVCKLKKALYGLKQAPRTWFDKLR